MPPKGKKLIKKIKLSDISFGNTGQDEIAIRRDFNHTCKYGAVVSDIEFEGDIKLVINHKIKINLSSDGRPIEYCIGQRLIECMNPTIEIFSTNGKAQLIKMKARLYDMSKRYSNNNYNKVVDTNSTTLFYGCFCRAGNHTNV